MHIQLNYVLRFCFKQHSLVFIIAVLVGCSSGKLYQYFLPIKVKSIERKNKPKARTDECSLQTYMYLYRRVNETDTNYLQNRKEYSDRSSSVQELKTME